MSGHVEEQVLSRVLDGECAEAEAKAVRAHVEACPDCRRALAGLERAHAAIAEALRAHPFDERLAARISAAARAPRPGDRAGPMEPLILSGGRAERSEVRPQSKGWFRRTAAPLAMAAALLVVASLAVKLLGDRGAAVRGAPRTVALVSDAGAVVIRGGSEAYVPGGASVGLRAGDKVRAERTPVTIRLVDGLDVLIRPDTTVELGLERARGDEVASVAIVDGPGDLYASAAPVAGRAPPLVLASGGIEVGHGPGRARFGVRFDGRAAFATVAEGEVVVRGPALAADAGAAPRPIAVPAGRRLAISLASRTADLGPADLAAELGWTADPAILARPVSPAPDSAAPAPAAPGPRPIPAPRPGTDGGSGGDLPISPASGEEEE